MPIQSPRVSPIEISVLGKGGVTGANRYFPQNREVHEELMMRYGNDSPAPGSSPGHNPAYGSVGNDGRWPGKRR